MFRSSLGISARPKIQTYRGFGSATSFYVLGRVTETIPEYNRDESSSWKNIKQILATYIVKPYVGEEVVVTYNNQEYITTTDEYGFFEISFVPKDVLVLHDTEWIEVAVQLTSTREIIPAEVLIEGKGNSYAIISDIDDTVLVSNVSKRIRLIYNTLTKSASRRVLFAGVKNLYSALVKGPKGDSTNPIVYISSSHWNLYAFLKDFFILQVMPRGPLLLRKFVSLRTLYTQRKNHNHKKVAIEKVIATYPTLPLVLIGDNGEQDIHIYTEIAKKYPGKIKAILIREVVASEKHTAHLLKHTDSTIPVYSSSDSSQLLEYAKAKNLVL